MRAEGIPITTLDGKEHRIIFDVQAVADIEDAFGSLGGMQDALEQIGQQPGSAKVFKPLLQILRAALRHDITAAGARFDTAAVADYYTAVMKAVDVSFPKGPRPGGPNPQTTNTDDSPGGISITSAPSDTDGLAPISGA